jgi:hypothetical protein
LIATVNSASFAGSATAQEQFDTFSHAIDFDAYAYYVRVDLVRNNPTDAIAFQDGCPRLDREARIAFEQLLRELRSFAWAP